MKKQDAEEFTQSLGQIVAGSWRQIALAKRLGVPKALGLSVEDWVQQKLGGYVRLSIPERREAVADLTSDGMSLREVADVLGLGGRFRAPARGVPFGTVGVSKSLFSVVSLWAFVPFETASKSLSTVDLSTRKPWLITASIVPLPIALFPRLGGSSATYLLAEASFEVDTEQASDLVVLKARDMNIACRVRRPGYLDRYPWDFTIRAQRDSGAKTELKKVINGWADWMFYGHAKDTDEASFAQWFLLDLVAFRAQFTRDGYRPRRRLRWGIKPNGDGTDFAWFDIRSFDPDPPLLIACDALAQVRDDGHQRRTNDDEWLAEYERGMDAS